VALIELVLTGLQAFLTAMSLYGLRDRRIAEQSSERKAMATRILAPHPNGTQGHPWDIDEDFQEVTEKVNEAIRIGEKFVALKTEGKARGFVATEITQIIEM
jgi:hypothetical protein